MWRRRTGNRLVARSVAALFVAVAVGAWSAPPTDAASSLDLGASYDVQAKLSWATASLQVDSRATVTNPTSLPVTRLDFNAAPFVLASPTITTVAVGGQRSTYSVDGQTLSVTLPSPLAPGGSTVVRIAYSASLLKTTTDKNWYFSKVNRIVTAYRWIPWLSRPTPFERPNFGTPIVTGVSPYVRVRITTDRALVIGASGQRTSATTYRQTFVARNVRDFNFSASPRYVVTTGRAGDIRIRVLSFAQPPSVMLKRAKQALTRLGELVGPYPYGYFTVAEAPPGASMESPAMVWIGQDVTRGNLPFIVTHETAHQWFYGVLGTDQASEPFADEGPTDFLARYLLGIRRASRCDAARLDLTVYDYAGRCYHEVIYIQGGNYLDDYRRRVGDDRFWAGMREYYLSYRFKVGGTRELLDALDAAAAPDGGGHSTRFPRYY